MRKHTPGPWSWTVNPKHHTVELTSLGNTVMKFSRWGMGGAQPWFKINGILRNVMDLFKVVKGREHHAEWHGTIDHPDARVIALAPESFEVCERLVKVMNGREFAHIGPEPMRTEELNDILRQASEIVAKMEIGNE